MNKRRIGICIFIIFLMLLFMLFMFRYGNYNRKQQQIQEETEADSQVTEVINGNVTNKEKPYTIYIEDGRLVVHDSNRNTPAFNTGIAVDSLPDFLQKELLNGIGFESEEELLDFIENYSS